MDLRECPPLTEFHARVSIFPVSSLSVIKYTQLTRICRLSSCFSHSESTNFPRAQCLCFQVQFHRSQTDTLATIVQPRRQGDISGSQRQDTRKFHGERAPHSQVYIFDQYSQRIPRYRSLSPKALFQRLGMHGARIHNSDAQLVSCISLRNDNSPLR